VNVDDVLTAEDLERISLPGKQVELIRGRLVVREPLGTWHGAIAARLAWLLSDFVNPRGLGLVFAQDTGFKIASAPDTVRAPDVAVVLGERVAAIASRGYAMLVPDLLAEIVSPGDSAAEVLSKVADWLAAGTKLVWVVDPERREIRVHGRDGSLSVLAEHDVLAGDDVLPGFNCPVARILMKEARSREESADG
jgi:Uma2 family endonuclease